ncbi:amino acid permease [Azospirillum sp. B510]|uniref:APC family permease n=1 Tax=Azospirillum sp. (strain B510) TaxID=137722 RepID=UPI0001C4C50D|nr:APC family permease [Azospirillum sp. B510]BAI72700.1 amino acid permease [Azospirillum sp. B510]
MSTPSQGDAGQLAELGYDQELKRDIGLFSVFSIGVATVAPVVGLYAIFSLGIQLTGPAWILMLLLSLAGQLTVAFVYSELASEFPIAGGPYHWTSRLAGQRFGMVTGIIYALAVTAALATVAYLAAPWVCLLVTGAEPQGINRALIAMGLLLAALIVNSCGIRVVAVLVNIGIAAEVIGSLGIGVVLILFFKNQPFTILFDTMGTAPTFATFLTALAVSGWAFVGFDASASVAEETTGARSNIPKAIIGATTAVGALVVLVAGAITLASTDLASVVSGGIADPVTAVVTGSLGSWSERPFYAIVVTTFIACIVSMQAYTGRIVFGLARDGVLPASRRLAGVSGASKVPVAAMTLVTVAAGLALLLGLDDKAIGTMISFGTLGLYATFFLVVAAALYARFTGRWRPDGAFRTGKIGDALNVVAFVWLTFETVNIAWPRAELSPPGASELLVWAPLGIFILVALFAVIAVSRIHRKDPA